MNALRIGTSRNAAFSTLSRISQETSIFPRALFGTYRSQVQILSPPTKAQTFDCLLALKLGGSGGILLGYGRGVSAWAEVCANSVSISRPRCRTCSALRGGLALERYSRLRVRWHRCSRPSILHQHLFRRGVDHPLVRTAGCRAERSFSDHLGGCIGLPTQ
jgi:hypothetical protein